MPRRSAADQAYATRDPAVGQPAVNPTQLAVARPKWITLMRATVRQLHGVVAL